MSTAYRGDTLHCEDVPLHAIAAQCGTPTYVYSHAAVQARLRELQEALKDLDAWICYPVKTCSNLAILDLLARAGCGFDIVSGGELHRLRHLGIAMDRVVFAGVGKTDDEMRAAIAAGIHAFNVESLPEGERLAGIAAGLGRRIGVTLRINPDLAAGGHAYISTGGAEEKFGVPFDTALDVYERLAALPALEPLGLHAHVGSQILDPNWYRRVAERLAELARALRARGQAVSEINVGGGLGIRYADETPLSAAAFVAAIRPVLAGLGVRLLVEPGRFLMGNAGWLLTRVLYLQDGAHKRFVVVDAAMNDLLRPSLYAAHHDILPLRRPGPDAPVETVDVVGPVCESGDFLARGRRLALPTPGDLLAVCSAGAYGFVMSSNYNSRPRAAEVLVSGSAFHVVRARETLADLVRGECVPALPPATPRPTAGP